MITATEVGQPALVDTNLLDTVRNHNLPSPYHLSRLGLLLATLDQLPSRARTA